MDVLFAWEVSPAPPTFPEVPLYIMWQDIIDEIFVFCVQLNAHDVMVECLMSVNI